MNVPAGTQISEDLIVARSRIEKLTPLPKPQFTTVNEQNRTYTFPTGKVYINGIESINVSKSGTHRINTTDGKKHIIPSGWLHIEFDAKDWTF